MEARCARLELKRFCFDLLTFGIITFLLTGCATRSVEPEGSATDQSAQQNSEPPSSKSQQRARSQWRIDPERPMSLSEVAEASAKPPDQAELEGDLGEVTKDFAYGPGLGRASLNVATVILFPPYAIYLVGNALLSLGGYDQLHVTDALPEKGRDAVLSVYDGVTSVPGRLTAGIANEEFREAKAEEKDKDGEKSEAQRE